VNSNRPSRALGTLLRPGGVERWIVAG